MIILSININNSNDDNNSNNNSITISAIYIYACTHLFPIFNHIKSQFGGYHPATLHRATGALAALRIAVPFALTFVTSG